MSADSLQTWVPWLNIRSDAQLGMLVTVSDTWNDILWSCVWFLISGPQHISGLIVHG